MTMELPTLPSISVDDEPLYPTDTNVFLKQSIDKYTFGFTRHSHFDVGYDINEGASQHEEIVGAVSDTFYMGFITSGMISNTTHGLMDLFMNYLQNVTNKNKHDNTKLILTLEIQLDKDIDDTQCNIKPILPVDFTKQWEKIEVYLRIESYKKAIDCEALPLISTLTDWNISIRRTKLSHVMLLGNYVFLNVQFGKGCKILHSRYLAFIKSHSVSNNELEISSSTLNHLAVIESDMPHLVFGYLLMSTSFDSVLISQSSVRLGEFRIEVNTFWIYDSVVIGWVLGIGSLDQFVMYNSSISLQENQFAHIEEIKHFKLEISFAKLVYIDHFLDNKVPIQISVEYSVKVVLRNMAIRSIIIDEQLGSILYLRGIKILLLEHSLFEGNSAKRIIDCEYVNDLRFSYLSFKNNTSTEFPISISGKISNGLNTIRASHFAHNKAMTRGTISIQDNTLIMERCVFEENEGVNGGALFLQRAFRIGYSKFIRNKASNNGGSLYITYGGYLEYVEFSENQVTGSELTNCGKDCDGSGGAIYFTQQVSKGSLTAVSCKFEKNTAVRGGAIFSSTETEKGIVVYSSVLNSNIAKYGGGAIYHHSTTYPPILFLNSNSGNQAQGFGDYFASAISSVIWKLQLNNEENSINLSESNNTISVYPGQLFSLIPVFTDLFSNTIVDRKEIASFKLSHSNFTIGRSSSYGGGKEFTNLYISTNQEEHSLNVRVVTLFISFAKLECNLSIQIQQCPKGYLLTGNTLNKDHLVCVFEKSNDYIIAVAVSVTIVVISLLICSAVVISMLIYKASSKIKYWIRRDKAEKDIEKRLLENELNPEEGEMKSVKSLNFVISIDQISIERKIGEGGSGVVYLGKWHHHPVAVKCLRLQDGYQNSDEIEKEASLLCQLRHPNIVLFFGVSITPQKQYLIVEYLEKGSLEKHIKIQQKAQAYLPFVEKLKLLIDVTCGMTYLHSLKVIHRDLKPGNILLDSMGVAKVCDFGISKMAGNTLNSTTVCAGTIGYMAPELLQSDAEKSRITTSVDVYSFSIIMYELFFEQAAYSKSTKMDMFKHQENQSDGKYHQHHQHLVTPFSIISKVIQGQRPEIPFQTEQQTHEWLEMYMMEFNMLKNCQSKVASIVNDYLELMKACWSPEPEHRPNFETIFNCISLLRQQFIDLTEYQKQVNKRSESTISCSSSTSAEDWSNSSSFPYSGI